ETQRAVVRRPVEEETVPRARRDDGVRIDVAPELRRAGRRTQDDRAGEEVLVRERREGEVRGGADRRRAMGPEVSVPGEEQVTELRVRHRFERGVRAVVA